MPGKGVSGFTAAWTRYPKPRWVGKGGVTDCVGAERAAHGKAEQVDHLGGIRTDQVGADDAPAVFFHQHLVAVARRVDGAGGNSPAPPGGSVRFASRHDYPPPDRLVARQLR